MDSRDSGLGIRHSGLGLALFLTYTSLCHAAVQSTAPADGSPRISVRVYNYTGVTRGTLARAEEEASRIFREAGIETT